MRRMKKARQYLLGIFAALLLCGIFSVNTVKADTQYVYDNASLLSDEEEQDLERSCAEFESNTDIHMVILTEYSSGSEDCQAIADDFYDKKYPKEPNGVCFLIDMGQRQIVISTSGIMQYYMSDAEIDDILQAAQSYAKEGDYAGTFAKMTHPDVHFAMTLLPRISDAAHPPYDLLVDSDGMNGDDGFHERILLAVPQSSPLAARTSLRLNDLRGQEFISVMGNRRFREQCSQLCQQSGFMPQYAYECTGPSTVRNLISLGCGVGFWPEYTWGAPGEGIRLLPIDDARCVRRIVLRCDASGDIRPLAEEFRAALQDELQLLASKKRA